MDQTISHYRILQKLGEGGMGEVYLAEDLALGRKVALKFLSGESSRQPDRIARLEREGRAVSALNHPNILVIHEIGRAGESCFIASEYVEGETLRDRLQKERMDPIDALDIAAQMLAALEAAHSAGIIHRDIKPENIKIRPDGYVKVLDFGLVKMDQSEQVSEHEVTALSTSPGMMVGTVPYMSPEQVRGRTLDARTDLFSVAVVLYEMLTGKRPFDGETPLDILSAILNAEPSLNEIPEELRDVLRKALEKQPEDRHGTAKEFLEAIRSARRLMVADLPHGGAVPLPRLAQITFAAEVEGTPDLSHDGKRIVFSREVSGVRKLFVKDLDTEEERPCTTGNHDDIQPAWSPDGEEILFVRAREPGIPLQPGDVFGEFSGGDIWSVDLKSGRQARILQNAFNPSFSPDGARIAFDASWAGPRRIWLSSSKGNNPTQITSDVTEEAVHVRPRWSPNGLRIVFQNIERTKFDIRVVDVETRSVTWVTNDLVQDLHPVWSPSGRYIYFSTYRSGGLNLWRIAVSKQGRPLALPQQVTAGAGQDVEPCISRDGRRIAFSILKQNADIWRLPVHPATGEPAGTPEAVVATSREDSRGAWSPDGQAIALNSDRSGDMNIWVFSLKDRTSRRMTRGPGGDYQPNWSPDSEWIAFFSSRAGTPDIWKVHVASGHLDQLTSDDSININPFFSPDGNWIAYQSDQSGRTEVWVMRSDGSGQRQLSRNGVRGHFMRWRADGRAVVFFSPFDDPPGIYRVDLESGEPELVARSEWGSHLSFSPDQSLIADVVGHKAIWILPLSGEPRKVFEFPDPAARIDYPVWSPDGRWLLFDLFQPQGGDIWMMESPE